MINFADIILGIIQYRGAGTGLADPATAGPKFPVYQESPPINIILMTLIPRLIQSARCNQATLKFILQLHVYAKAIALLYIIAYYIKNTRTNLLKASCKALTSFKIRRL